MSRLSQAFATAHLLLLSAVNISFHEDAEAESDTEFYKA